MLLINISLFVVPAFMITIFCIYKQNNLNNLIFYFNPYVFKNKEFIFCKKDINNIIADILLYKIKNNQINAKILQKNITAQYFTQNFNKNV